MAKYDYDMIVIGGGAAGLTASTFAGLSGAKTLLIEKEDKLGGDCLHFGCVPSKTLIKSSYVYHAIRRSAHYGLPKVDLPPVNFSKIKERILNTVSIIQKHDDPQYLNAKFHVQTRFGLPAFCDEHTIVLDGEKITSRYFVIATGSTAFIPPIDGLDQVSYMTNRDIFYMDDLPDHLVILGAGPIGMEMAQAFVRFGSKVTVVDAGPRPLPKEDDDVSDYVTAILKEEGVDFIMKAKAERVDADGGDIMMTVAHSDSAFKDIVKGSSLLVSAGRRPNVDGLALDQAGVIFNDQGIITDDKTRTNVKHIYACGDFSGGYQFTHAASHEAIVAVYNAILRIPKTVNSSLMPWVTYLDPEVASIGYNEKRAAQQNMDFDVHKELIERNDRALAEGETKGFLKLLTSRHGRPIGVQIVSFHAGDLISEWIPVLNAKMNVSAVSSFIHPYPTMAEVNKLAAVQYEVSKIPAWTGKLARTLFGYQGEL